MVEYRSFSSSPSPPSRSRALLNVDFFRVCFTTLENRYPSNALILWRMKWPSTTWSRLSNSLFLYSLICGWMTKNLPRRKLTLALRNHLAKPSWPLCVNKLEMGLKNASWPVDKIFLQENYMKFWGACGENVEVVHIQCGENGLTLEIVFSQNDSHTFSFHFSSREVLNQNC